MPNELTLTATWGRDPLPAGGDGQLAYLLIDLLAEAGQQAVAGPALPLNLALVLDHSGSMSGPKLQHLKEAVGRVIDQLSPQDTLSVTVFDEKAKLLVPAQTVTDREALHTLVGSLREAGGTQMSSGLRMGLDEVRKNAGANVVSRLLLLTDGQTWGDADQCVALAAEAGQAGIPISAFGVGAEEDWSVSLLDRIAEASGGQSDYIAQPADTIASFRKTVQTMQATAVQRATLTLQLSAGVNVRALHRITPMIARVQPQADSTGAVSVPLGDIGRDAPVSVLFELTLPPRRPGQYRIARAVAHYAVPGAEDTAGQVDQDILLSFVVGLPSSPGNPRVMNIVEKATAFRLQTRALEEAEVGHIAEASRNLRSAATRLLSLGETDLAQQAEQEAQRLESKGQMSPGGTKKLTFATRKLGSEDMPAESAAPAPAPTPAPAPAPVEGTAPAPVPISAAGETAAPAPAPAPVESAAPVENAAPLVVAPVPPSDESAAPASAPPPAPEMPPQQANMPSTDGETEVPTQRVGDTGDNPAEVPTQRMAETLDSATPGSAAPPPSEPTSGG
jgi:Ca-activated chloride channel family protein